MKETRAIVERITRLNEHFQRLHLAVEDPSTELKPGQSYLARRLPESWDPYLRERWWPVSVTPTGPVIERPGSSVYEPGEVVSLLGTIGQPYRYRRTLRNVLLLAFDAAPTPLIMSAAWLLGNGVSVTLVLSGRATLYPTQHLPPELEIIRADDELNWPNRVMTVGWADQVFVVVAPDDELIRLGRIWSLFKDLRAELPANFLFGVLQPTLPCGVGACQACMVLLQKGETSLTCLDGPALDLTTLPLS